MSLTSLQSLLLVTALWYSAAEQCENSLSRWEACDSLEEEGALSLRQLRGEATSAAQGNACVHVDAVFDQHIRRVLQHFRVEVLLSCQDPSKLKLDRSKQEIRARVDDRVVVVVSLQDPVRALRVSRELDK